MTFKAMIRLSYSTLELVNVCERMFQLEKLLAGSSKEDSEHLSFGKAFGAGVAAYLQDQDADRALYEAWLAYWPIEETDKKNQARCFVALERAFPELDTLLMEYELVYFEGKPAVELNFRLNIDEEYYYVGYIDAVLRNRFTQKYIVFECKHTGSLLLDLTPFYKNSGQALGYSIVLDRIAGEDQTEYEVMYFVAQLGKEFNAVRLHTLVFDKTLADRLNWFLMLGLDVERLKRMADLGIYPMRSGSCVRFNRPCRHFGVCNLHALDTPKAEEPDEVEYQFIYQLDDLVNDHLIRTVV